MKKTIIVVLLSLLLVLACFFVFNELKQRRVNGLVTTVDEASETIKQPSMAINLFDGAADAAKIVSDAAKGLNQYSTPGNLEQLLGEMYSQLQDGYSNSGYSGNGTFEDYLNGN